MKGKIVVVGIVGSALLAGVGIWWTENYAYYTPVSAEAGATEMTVTSLMGTQEPLLASEFEGIDADTSPLRFRACFETPLSLAMMTESFEPHPEPTPLIAPGWFDCFDAEALTNDLEAGSALAFMGQNEIAVGVDRVIAIYPDGRGYAWHQLNGTLE